MSNTTTNRDKHPELFAEADRVYAQLTDEQLSALQMLVSDHYDHDGRWTSEYYFGRDMFSTLTGIRSGVVDALCDIYEERPF